jgi:hypothetical protein
MEIKLLQQDDKGAVTAKGTEQHRVVIVALHADMPARHKFAETLGTSACKKCRLCQHEVGPSDNGSSSILNYIGASPMAR